MISSIFSYNIQLSVSCNSNTYVSRLLLWQLFDWIKHSAFNDNLKNPNGISFEFEYKLFILYLIITS